ncbi:MAG: hypothetical protein JRD89_19775 [Deltaproteobacteria bacterium]|nr:hypothetical protein [Deltaproteobacteria bacterium]
MAYSDEEFVLKKNDVENALQEFKTICEESPDGEDFEHEVETMMEDLK